MTIVHDIVPTRLSKNLLIASHHSVVLQRKAYRHQVQYAHQQKSALAVAQRGSRCLAGQESSFRVSGKEHLMLVKRSVSNGYIGGGVLEKGSSLPSCQTRIDLVSTQRGGTARAAGFGCRGTPSAFGTLTDSGC